MPELARCAVHTITNKPWDLATCLEKYAAAGFGGVSVWRNVVEAVGVNEAARLVHASGLRVPAYVRGGFFCGDEAQRAAALAENKLIVDEAAAIGAEMVVLVCGARPGLPLSVARDQIAAGIETLLPYAEQMNVKLAIEPLHPMYAADRSAINTMGQARKLCEMFRSEHLGIALDVYHTWWDQDLEHEIDLAGRNGTLLALHVCDWKQQTQDLLNDRGLMGEGVIDIRGIRRACEDAGFEGMIEVEIFSNRWWAADQDEFLQRVAGAFVEHV